jgi:LPXTG-motif cell wall-anchored protein
MSKGLIIGGIVVLLVGGGAGYYFYKKKKSESAESTETKQISASAVNPTTLANETADEKDVETESTNEGVNGILGIGAFSTSRGEVLKNKLRDECTGLIA